MENEIIDVEPVAKDVVQPDPVTNDNITRINEWFNREFCNTGMPTELFNRALKAKEALIKIFA